MWSPRSKFEASHERRMGTLFFVPIQKVGVEETAKYTTQHFDFKQTLQVGPRAEAQELIGEDAGRTVASTESFIH